MLRARVIAAGLITCLVTPAFAQPVDPYAPLDGEPAAPTPPAVGEKDPAIAEAVALALVERARELMAAEQWADAQQLLGEAVVESPDGPAAQDARGLLEEVNRQLGIGVGTIADPYADVDDSIGDPIDPIDDNVVDPFVDVPPPVAADGGKNFYLHTALMGGMVGGFFGDAVTADLEPEDGIDSETPGPIIGGFLIGALAGAGVGAAFRKNKWLTRADVVTVDSFTAMGLLGSLSFTALTNPAESEAYSVSGILGTVGGAITGLVMAKRRDISVKRMTRIDLWAAAGGLGPWLLFAAATDKSADSAQAFGFLSTAGLIGGAWLGFRLTRKMDGPTPSTIADAPAGVVQRDSDGSWHAGTLSLRPLEPGKGRGGTLDLVGVAF